jgi:hypothetical protein
LDVWFVFRTLHTVHVIICADFCALVPCCAPGASALRLPPKAAAKLTCSVTFVHTYSSAVSPVSSSYCTVLKKFPM